MGLFTLSFAGGSLLLIGAWESLIATSTAISPPTSSSSFSSWSSSHNKAIHKTTISESTPSTSSPPNPNPSFSTVTLISTASLSVLFFVDSLLSFLDALHSRDQIGSALQLQRKDPDGIENRYYDLMLVPIAVCVFSTLIELKSPQSNMPRLARGIGLILQGTWFVQMGFSFYSDYIANNCSLRERSRGNYTVVCKGHMDSHRGMAIAVLLFNCHLAFLVAVIVGVYSIVGRRLGGHADYTRYRPLGAEMHPMDTQPRFTLESDDEEEEEEEDGIREIREEEAMSRQENVILTLEVNGHGSHH
ncbi:hypothetical protein Dimus_011306 [Dionaea muscipula]